MQSSAPALFFFVMAIAGSAWAGNFQVSPVVVALTTDARSSLVAIRNQSDEVLRLQVKTHGWQQSTAGEMLLAPTEELIVFPTLLQLKPGETRNVRIGLADSAAAKGAIERSFRVFVEELPPLRAVGALPGIRVLTRMGIPIFVGGKDARHRLELGDAAATDGHLTFALRNRGDAHVMTRQMEASLLDGSGAVLARRTLVGWYLLPRGERRYDADLGAIACAAKSVRLVVQTDKGPWESAAALPGCAR